MLVSQPPPITGYGRAKTGRKPGSLYGTPPANKWPSCRPDLLGKRFGRVIVVSEEIQRIKGKLHVYVRCPTCSREAWVSYSNLRRGRSGGCRACGQPRRIPRWLQTRLAQAKDRCTNANNKRWRDYGGRGIEFRFRSVLEAGLWIKEHLGLNRHLEIDRKENNGHYEAGNLRWATRKENANNTRRQRCPLCGTLRTPGHVIASR